MGCRNVYDETPVMAIDAFATLLSGKHGAMNDRARAQSLCGSTWHANPKHAKGAPHGDGN